MGNFPGGAISWQESAKLHRDFAAAGTGRKVTPWISQPEIMPHCPQTSPLSWTRAKSQVTHIHSSVSSTEEKTDAEKLEWDGCAQGFTPSERSSRKEGMTLERKLTKSDRSQPFVAEVTLQSYQKADQRLKRI